MLQLFQCEKRYNHKFKATGTRSFCIPLKEQSQEGCMTRPVLVLTEFLVVLASLSGDAHKRMAQLPSAAPQELIRRVGPEDGRRTPGPKSKEMTLESATALAALPTQLSLGEWRPVGPWNYAGKAYDVAVSPIDPNTVFAAFGSGGGLWKTSDGGRTWLQLTDRSDLTDISCVSVHPNLPDIVVACIGGPGNPSPRRGLLYSLNGGRHWEFIGPADGLSVSFYRAILHPTDPNTIYAASESGVYLTRGSWRPLETGLGFSWG